MTASTYVPPIARPFVGIYNRVQKPVTRLGHMVAFFFRAIAGVPIVLRHYWKEFLRHLSDIAWGNGSLVVGGGTAGVMIVLGVIAGGLVAIEGYNFLDLLGLGPATGIISSLVNTRELAPIMAAIAFPPRPAAASPPSSGPCASPRRSMPWTPSPSGPSPIW
ncbi:Putative YrbE family protein [Mycobacteroides abscessus]|nr:Putative YrbE family protein [Mycobacteroides abscessus]